MQCQKYSPKARAGLEQAGSYPEWEQSHLRGAVLGQKDEKKCRKVGFHTYGIATAHTHSYTPKHFLTITNTPSKQERAWVVQAGPH